MHFLAQPGGSAEDDGVLVTIVFDGPKQQVGLPNFLNGDDDVALVSSPCPVFMIIMTTLTPLVIDHRVTCFSSTQKPSGQLTELTSPTTSPGQFHLHLHLHLQHFYQVYTRNAFS